MAKKLKKAILAGLAAYAGAKMLKASKAKAALSGVPEGADLITKKAALVDAADAGTKFPKKPYPDAIMRGQKGVKDARPFWKFWKDGGSISAPIWKKHGGAIRTEHAKLGKMIKAAQGTYAREDESLGMRLGKGKGTAKERDMSYGDWGKRKTDWASKGKMVKARGGVYVNTKLNGKLFTETF